MTPQSYPILSSLLGLREDEMRRKGNQTGSVRAIAGRWYVQFSRWTHDAAGNLAWRRTELAMEREGVPVMAVGRERVGKREALRLAYDLYVAPANQINAAPAGMLTLDQFIEVRFRPDHIQRLKASGRHHYDHILRAHVTPTLGAIQLSQITPDVVQRLLTAKSGVYASQTVYHVRNVISAIFRHARRLGYYAGALPTEDAAMPRLTHAERRALTWPQVVALTDAMPRRWQALVIVLAQTGMRIGEAAGLNWADINLEDADAVRDGILIPENTICVRRQWTKGEMTDLKGTDKVRMFPLTAETFVALQVHREQSDWRGEHQPVFAGHGGCRLDGHNVGQRSLKTAAAKINAPWVSWHVLRHTAATLADRAGLTSAEKMKILGHRTAAMTNRYTHPELSGVRAKLELITEGYQRNKRKAG